jgi:hypothetical protein
MADLITLNEKENIEYDRFTIHVYERDNEKTYKTDKRHI